jgi:hypothetical protein
VPQGNDPTNGYVNYISYDEASSSGLYKIENGSVYMGVDTTNVATGRGRDSIRISTTKVYNHALVILDLAHMPAGACGTWPAFWMLGPNWPTNGEIDIIEGVNTQTTNSMTLHTDSGCTITNTGAFSGTLSTSNCDVNAPNQVANAGCSIGSPSTNSFGNGFNDNGGGVYATEWTSEEINIWFFPRGSVPADITAGTPEPTNWGLPQAQFTGGCDLDEHVRDQQLVFDVTFCGDWAGTVWSSDATCAPLASTCQAYVQNNPSAFQDTFWLIDSLKVYTDNGAAAPTQTATTSIASLPTSTAITATIAPTQPSSIFVPPVPTTPPTTLVTVAATSAVSYTYTPPPPAAITTAPSWTASWPTPSPAWSTGSWSQGGQGGGDWGSWSGANGGSNNNNNGGNGGWGGRGRGGGWR